jgi:hypothetical protein
MSEASNAIAQLLKDCVGTPGEKLLPVKLRDMAHGMQLANKVSAIRHLTGDEGDESAEQIAEVLYEEAGNGTIVRLHRMVKHLLTIQTVEQVYANFMEDIQSLQSDSHGELKSDKYKEINDDCNISTDANPDS